MNDITETKKPRTLKSLLSEEKIKALTRTPKLQECTPESESVSLVGLPAPVEGIAMIDAEIVEPEQEGENE